MRRLRAIGCREAAAGAVALAVLAVLAGCWPRDDALVAACEQVLLDRLASPSGYRRIDTTKAAIARPMTVIEMEDAWLAGRKPGEHWDALNARRAAYAEGRLKPARWQARIVYDAPNRFGAAVRDFAMCEWDDVEGAGLSALARFDVRVDGLTGLEFLRKAVER